MRIVELPWLAGDAIAMPSVRGRDSIGLPRKRLTTRSNSWVGEGLPVDPSVPLCHARPVTGAPHLPWQDLLDQPVARAFAKLIERRWSLGLGYVAAGSAELRPPYPEGSLCQVIQTRAHGAAGCVATARQIVGELAGKESDQLTREPQVYACHAGLVEAVVPLVIDGQLVGSLVAGGFILADGAAPALAEIDRRTVKLSLPIEPYREAQARVARLDKRELAYLEELLALCAEELMAELVGPGPRAPTASKSSLRHRYDAILGRSPPMQELYRLLDKIVASEATVLIQGENGTGKELIARAIHDNSARKGRRFIAQNCSAFNDNLLDSELFGHKRGAFTGAIADKRGLFDLADGGTFFLDEVGDMSPTLQIKLLRVLQEGTLQPVGDTASRHVDVRIIAATNRDLAQMVTRGEFREDLFYRIHVINVCLPPLRERQDDIPVLVKHFLRKHAPGKLKMKHLGQPCLERLLAHPWPGNVRELENEIERLVVLAGDEIEINEELLSPRIQPRMPAAEEVAPSGLPASIEALERRMIAESLRRHRGNKTRAAADLKVSRRNLIRLVQKYELEMKPTRSP